MVDKRTFNVLMDIIIMLPKILLFLKTFSTNKALKRSHFVFAGGLIMLIQMKFVLEPFATFCTVKWFFRCVVYLFVMSKAGNTIGRIITDVPLYCFMSNFFVCQ